MKKTGFILIAFLLLQSCYKEELPIPYGDVSVQIAFEKAYNHFPKNNIKVQITEQNNTVVATAFTNNRGEAIFKNIINDVYKVKISHTFSESTVFSLVGLQDELKFIGETGSMKIVASQTKKETIILKTNKIGGFVIKEVYNSNAGGGSDAEGFYEYVRFNDAFFEIYNNSPETMYADNLQIGIATNEYEKKWREDNKNVYVEQIFKIKGSGKQYPVLPGKSIVIASTAINHINASGLTKEQIDRLYLFGTVKKSVDLSKADFEVYFDGFATNYDIDVANVPNLQLQFNTHPAIKEIVTTNRGIGLVIFKNIEIQPLEVVKVKRGKNIFRVYQYKKIPIDFIIDAFESQKVQCFPKQIVGEKLPVLRAWEGKSYRRKVNTIVNGRKVLLNTNNCVVDFEKQKRATPGIFLKKPYEKTILYPVYP